MTCTYKSTRTSRRTSSHRVHSATSRCTMDAAVQRDCPGVCSISKVRGLSLRLTSAF